MGSITLLWPICLLLLALPFIIRYLPGKRKKDEFIFITSLPYSLEREPQNKVRLMFGLCYAAWFFLVIALCRPVYLDEVIVVKQPHRDIMLAVDLSDSMDIKDMYDINNAPQSRLDVVKEQLAVFVKNRLEKDPNDRLGLIVFADQADVLSPLTFDKQLLLSLVDELDLNLAGQYTNISDAIKVALERFEEAQTNQKILILLSDGKNTTEGPSPIEMANIAKENNMKIYTIGFGGRTAVSVNTNSLDDTSAELDEETLKQIATITGANYYRVSDGSSLKNRYQEINYKEPQEESAISYQPEIELYHWFLLISVILSVVAAIAIRRING